MQTQTLSLTRIWLLRVEGALVGCLLPGKRRAFPAHLFYRLYECGIDGTTLTAGSPHWLDGRVPGRHQTVIRSGYSSTEWSRS